MDNKTLTIGLTAAFAIALVVAAASFTLSTDTIPDPVAPPVVAAEIEPARPVPVELPPQAARELRRSRVGAARAETPRVPRQRRAPDGEARDRSSKMDVVAARKIERTQGVFEKVLADSEDLSASEQDEIRTLVDGMHDDALATLEELRSGSLSSDEARTLLQDQRGAVDQDIAALLGSDRADLFLADVDTMLSESPSRPAAGARVARRAGGEGRSGDARMAGRGEGRPGGRGAGARARMRAQ
ncbi:MAG: hypothetical protein H6738_08530 [Alphaproteobacteria bacterium]|nr:hypothetical protein [Alphaproteobacteria bacterium]MCB9696806.1 hypothetical protein [Alphaproteobacteria bacterium]